MKSFTCSNRVEKEMGRTVIDGNGRKNSPKVVNLSVVFLWY